MGEKKDNVLPKLEKKLIDIHKFNVVTKWIEAYKKELKEMNKLYNYSIIKLIK